MGNKILVVPGNTDLNRGDQALVWESIRIFEEIFPDLEIYLYESGAGEEEKKLQKAQTANLGYNFTARILQHPRVKSNNTRKQIKYGKLVFLKWGFNAVFDLIFTVLLISRFSLLNAIGKASLTKEQKKSLELFPELSALVVKGGGFLHSYGKIHDAYVMYYFLFDLMLAHKYKVKTLILPNSIGPIKNRVARWLVKRVLKKSNFVSAREDVSKEFLKNELNVDAPNIPDLAFFLESDDRNMLSYLESKGFDRTKNNIAITLRPYRFDGYTNADQLYRNYLNEITLFIETQINRGYCISLVAHTLGPSAHEDDRLALKDVYNNLDEQIKASVVYLEDFGLNCRQIQKLYSYYDLLVGTRFHSVIFALNEKVPAISIAYGGNKSYGIMKDIGVPEFVVGIDSVSSNRLNEMVFNLEENRQNYLEKIVEYHLKLIQKRNKLMLRLEEILK
ncbi:polysaccharide pyruvyl transferase family protein [Cyclobacterium sp. SYSU L10401]|uniref:polysaccharide pyruvyl transferase family protein n=1 Tax=Cyclobacterium sp. SYSU L10401 TaxID=2678657 RepID=UPI0013D194F2|nr:polysaccharide pyruvyl transferase family protein [Cyclobacterium sp. SYSU L10401]